MDDYENFKPLFEHIVTEKWNRDFDDFIEWWQENGEFLKEKKVIYQAGDYYIAQQAFLAGRKKKW